MKTKINTSKRKKKQYQPAEKVSIVRQHLIEKMTVSDICDEYGLRPSVYYRWQKQFFENGEKAFVSAKDSALTRLKQEINYLESKLARKDEVLGELMEEYVMLKKTNGAH